MQRIALITGANKGIGLEIARQLGMGGMQVIIGCRDRGRGMAAIEQLTDVPLRPTFLKLDVTDLATISKAADEIQELFGRLDVLINNAGITGGGAPLPSATEVQFLRTVYETNLFGVVAITNAMLPLLKLSVSPRIVNMSSGLGSITLAADPTSEFGSRNYMAYQSSKSALNAVTVCYSKELAPLGFKVNAADPGFTATDLNNHQGYRTVEQAATVAVRLATLPNNGPTGTFQDDNGPLPW